MKQSPIHRAALRIAHAFNEMEISFAIADSLAVNARGRVRTTEDVDILLRPNDLVVFKEARLGRGWVEKIAGSRGIRDAVDQANIDVFLTGGFPGDGLTKPVAFPDPATSIIIGQDGLPILN